jgi:hypothetical protein
MINDLIYGIYEFFNNIILVVDVPETPVELSTMMSKLWALIDVFTPAWALNYMTASVIFATIVNILIVIRKWFIKFIPFIG